MLIWAELHSIFEVWNGERVILELSPKLLDKLGAGIVYDLRDELNAWLFHLYLNDKFII